MLPIPKDFELAFPTTKNKELQERFGVSKATVIRWAKECGLRKDESHKSMVQAERMVGRKRSEETRQKLSDARNASQQSGLRKPYNRTAPAPRGEAHHNWKGGNPWKRFKDRAYIAWRLAVLQRDGYRCNDCGRQCKKSEKGLAAHHIKPYASHPELRLDVDNGLTLCRACHMVRHGRAPRSKDQIPCACGYGTMIDPFDKYAGRPRLYVNHHHRRGPDSLLTFLQNDFQKGDDAIQLCLHPG